MVSQALTNPVFCTCRHVGREIVYVDLAANPATSADNPPDLAQYADAAQPYAGASQSNAGAAAVSRAKPSAARPEAAKGKRKDQAAATVIRIPRGDDVDSITRSILAKVSPGALCYIWRCPRVAVGLSLKTDRSDLGPTFLTIFPRW
jgi:hypothetical protein